jgi:large subunit ribosomal protein L24
MKIHTGDSVLVIAGKDRGKTGRIVRVLHEQGRVVVEGINMRTRHIRRTAQAPGQRIRYEASIAACNVMLFDPKTKKPTRIGYTVDPKTGTKSRIARLSGAVIEKTALPVTSAAPSDEKKTEKTAVEKPAKKTPFWKRGKGKEASAQGEKHDHGAPADMEHPTSVTPVRRSRESS